MRIATLLVSPSLLFAHRFFTSHKFPRVVVTRCFSQNDNQKPKRRRITQEELDTIVRLKKKGQTYAGIAATLPGIPINSMTNAFAKFCKATGSKEQEKRLFLTHTQHEEITKMRLEGKTWGEIGLVYGLNPTNMGRRHRRYKSDPHARPRRDWSADEIRNLLHARNDLHKSWTDIAHALDRSFSSVRICYWRENVAGEPNQVKHPRKYSQEELDKLVNLREVQKLPWKEISERMPERRRGSLKDRYNALNFARTKTLLPRRLFSQEEDQKLNELRTVRGLAWNSVAAAMPQRNLDGLQRRYRILRRRENSPTSSSVAHQSVDL